MNKLDIRARLDAALDKSRVLVMAHRGMAGANIVDNTIEAFEVALQGGADMLEMDVCASTDGDLFVMHDGTEQLMFGFDRNVTTMSSAEIRQLRFLNKNRTQIEHAPHSFDEVLDYLKDRTIINLDRCWDHWPDVFRIVKDHHMEDQVLLKSPCTSKYIDYLDEYETKFMYDPFITHPRELELLNGKDINWVCIQSDAYHEDDLDMAPEFLNSLAEKGICRSICAMTLGYPFSKKTIDLFVQKWGGDNDAAAREKLFERVKDCGIRPANGRDDDRSVKGDPDGGWGWLIDRGFNVLMTDWPVQMTTYLKRRGLKE